MATHTIVLYPSPGMGHLISMVELGKLILKQYPSFCITILITIPPYNTGSTSPYINQVSKNIPSLTFHYLPIVSVPSISSIHKEAVYFELLRLNNSHIYQALLTISTTSTVSAFIIDFFCSSSLDVANQLNIPVYYFFTSGVSVLSVFLYLPTIHKNTTKSLKDIDTFLNIPGIPPIHSSDMIKPILDRTDIAYDDFLHVSTQMPKSRGIIVNTFENLEPVGLKAVTDGLSVPDRPTPPIYCIGPLIASGRSDNGHACLEWLDKQPSKSVVYLCFGSLGLFSEEQLKETAIGLEKSGHRFLWVVRSPPNEDTTKRFLAPPEPDLDALLPDGFLERTKEMGLVVKSWAPQVEVLSRESVGGFVTHCGWNSVLEAVCAGVPLVGWPLYAEQKMNRVILVEGMKLALSMQEGADGFVAAAEVEKKVRRLMESEEGRAIRERMVKLSEEAKVAFSEGGSSVRALAELAELWKKQ